MKTLDPEAVRDAYNAGLSVFGGCPATRAEVLELRTELREYVDVLLPEATATAPRMRGEYRACAVHFLTRAREVLEELDKRPAVTEMEAPLDARPPVRDRDTVFELASLCRTALSVVTRPGPLGAPMGLEEIQDAVARRVCGACWMPIGDEEPVEHKTFTSDAGAAIRGYVHGELCTPRRPLLTTVPVQPPRPPAA